MLVINILQSSSSSNNDDSSDYYNTVCSPNTEEECADNAPIDSIKKKKTKVK